MSHISHRAEVEAAPRPDPDGYRVVSHRFSLDSAARWDAHSHPSHELLWGTEGALTVETKQGLFAVPAMIGLWIPAGVEHTVQSAGSTGFYCTYIDAELSWAHGAGPSAVQVTPLIRALLEHMHSEGMTPSARASAESLLLDLLAPQEVHGMVLPFPSDERLVSICRALLEDPADGRSLDQWGRSVGASARTLSRVFRSETGVTFEQWRIHARVRMAVSMLTSGTHVAAVSRATGYQTTSAFVHAFRKVMGHTPGRYLSGHASGMGHDLADSGN